MEPITLLEVRLEYLKFKNPSRELDTKNITKLLHTFEIQGCHHLKPDYCIPAVRSSQQWQAIGTTEAAKGFTFECLHGMHRIEAAKLFLPPAQRAWLVAIYLGIYLNAMLAL